VADRKDATDALPDDDESKPETRDYRNHQGGWTLHAARIDQVRSKPGAQRAEKL